MVGQKGSNWDPHVLAGLLTGLGLLALQDPGSVLAQSLFEAGSPSVQTSEPATLFRSTPVPSQPNPREPQYFLIDQPRQTFDPNFDPNVDPVVDPAFDPDVMVEMLDPDDSGADSDAEGGPVFDLDLRQQVGGSEGGGTGPSFGGGGTGSGQGTGGTSGAGAGSGAGSGSGFGSGQPGGTGQGWPGSGGLDAGTQQRLPQITGLIVDARGLDFEPSMSMRLFDPDGNQIYTVPGPNQELNTALVAGEGTAAYATTEEQLRTLTSRIGERPHRIRAIRTLGYDLVISNEDAWFLRQTNEMDRYLDNLSVAVMWDPAVARSF
jgi:hypothetical protein